MMAAKLKQQVDAPYDTENLYQLMGKSAIKQLVLALDSVINGQEGYGTIELVINQRKVKRVNILSSLKVDDE